MSASANRPTDPPEHGAGAVSNPLEATAVSAICEKRRDASLHSRSGFALM